MVKKSAQTRALHADRDLDSGTGVAPAIEQSVTHSAHGAEDFAQRASERLHDEFYARHGNPTSSRIAKVIADLEGGQTAMMFGSGMGAIATSVLAHLEAGDHVVAQTNHYIGTTDLVSSVLPRFGVEVSKVEQREVGQFEAAFRPNTRMLLAETPVNPTMQLTDLKAVADLARSRNAVSLCDNTFATPINQRPLELGFDLVCHSVTKYIGGHHDLLAGCVVGSEDQLHRIWHMSMTLGAVSAPFNSWLALRGVRTLSLRVAQHNTNAMALAEFLETHPAVSRVLYPGLPSHPQHDLAKQQMHGFGGLFSFILKLGYEAGVRFLERAEILQNAGSLGGVDTLGIQPAAMWGGRMSNETIREQGLEPGLIRIATGIEDTQDLLEDFEQALG